MFQPKMYAILSTHDHDKTVLTLFYSLTFIVSWPLCPHDAGDTDLYFRQEGGHAECYVPHEASRLAVFSEFCDFRQHFKSG